MYFSFSFQNTFDQHSMYFNTVLIGMDLWHGDLFNVQSMRSARCWLHKKIRFDSTVFCQWQTQLHSGIHGSLLSNYFQWIAMVSENANDFDVLVVKHFRLFIFSRKISFFYFFPRNLFDFFCFETTTNDDYCIEKREKKTI